MARTIKTITTMSDDLTGDEFAEGEGETVTFAVEGVSYQLDLSSASVEAFREHMGEYVQHARKVGGTSTRRTRGKASAPKSTAPKSTAKAASSGGSDGPSPAEVRAWAQANGVEVNNRGRISAVVIQRYLDAQK
jgi:hypothetical protein